MKKLFFIIMSFALTFSLLRTKNLANAQENPTPDFNIYTQVYKGTPDKPPQEDSPGYTILVTIENRGDAVSNAIVDIEIKRPSGEKVEQWFYTGEQFETGGNDKPYTAFWVPENQSGTYIVAVGIFAENWSQLYAWEEPEATIDEEGAIIQPSDEATCGRAGTNNFNACYYSGKNFNEFKLNRTDQEINFDWGQGSPHSLVPQDDFSAKWWGLFEIEGGEYKFTVTTDDGFKLIVDNEVLIDKVFDQAATTYTARKTLSTGLESIIAEYYENDGDAVAKLSWRKIDSNPPSQEESQSIQLDTYRQTQSEVDPRIWSFSADFRNTGTGPASAILDVELKNKNHEKVAQKFEEVTLSGGKVQTVNLETPPGLPPGEYYWSVGIFKPAWSELVQWHHALETFTIN